MTRGPLCQDALALLSHPERWRLHCSLCTEDVDSTMVVKADRRQWSKLHSHSHLHRELLFSLSGETIIGFSGDLYPCVPGSVFFFDAHEPHDNSYPTTSLNDFAHLWIGFASGHAFARVAIMHHEKLSIERVAHFSIDSDGRSDLSKPLHLLWPDFDRTPPELRRLKLFLAVAQTIALMLEVANVPVEQDNTCENRQNALVSKIREHIESCGGIGISLDSLSRLAGYSKYHFHRVFTEFSGESPKIFIDRCRMRTVLAMEEEHRTQKEIAFELGFSSASAFSRWRKRMADLGSKSYGLE
jgi:AraC-like DNA-binding protein